ncbi:g825 [Coccomyxa elongata]
MMRSGELALAFFVSSFPGAITSLIVFALTTPNSFRRIGSDGSQTWLILPTLFQFMKYPFKCNRVPSGNMVCDAWNYTQWPTNWFFMALLTAVVGISIAAACIRKEPE